MCILIKKYLFLGAIVYFFQNAVGISQTSKSIENVNYAEDQTQISDINVLMRIVEKKRIKRRSSLDGDSELFPDALTTNVKSAKSSVKGKTSVKGRDKVHNERYQNGHQRISYLGSNKGSLRINKIGLTEDDKFFAPIRMPIKFESYDRNRDGYISLQELIEVTGAVENAKYAFSDCDLDSNGRIEKIEFQNAPWDLSGQVDRSKQISKRK